LCSWCSRLTIFFSRVAVDLVGLNHFDRASLDLVEFKFFAEFRWTSSSLSFLQSFGGPRRV
jgi:hypothetical protein